MQTRPRWLGGSRRTGYQGATCARDGRAQRESVPAHYPDPVQELAVARMLIDCGLRIALLCAVLVLFTAGGSAFFDWLQGGPL